MVIGLLEETRSVIPTAVVDALLLQPKPVVPKTTSETLLDGKRDLVVFCPKCKALETLSFDGGRLLETRKFNQNDGHIFHDCNSDRACRVYRVN